MAVGTPALEGWGDLAEVSAAEWGTRTILTAIRFSHTELGYRFLGEDGWVWRPLPWGGRKRDLATIVLADKLVAAWQDVVAGVIRAGSWSLLSGQPVFGPVLVRSGRAPALAVFRNDRLVMSFSEAGQHWRITSSNGGLLWTTPPVVVDSGNGNIQAVDVMNPTNQTGSTLAWVETDDPP